MDCEFKKGVVTFLDVLGWKGIWHRKTKAIEWLEWILDNAQKYVVDLKESHDSRDAFKDYEVEIISISDTIVLITEARDSQVALEFHAGICALLLTDCFKSEMYIRGATTYGFYHNKNNIFVGPAIDEVAAWHESANWIGVIQTPTAYLSTKGTRKSRGILIDYPVPLKKGTIHTKCVNWPTLVNRHQLTDKDIYEGFMNSGSNIPDIYMKYQNTLDFYEYSNKLSSSKTDDL